MLIAVRGGHNFKVRGSSALIDETTEDRKVYKSVIKYLQLSGNKCLDVTSEVGDVQGDLADGVTKANNANADLFISIHFNKCYDSYNGKIGAETWIYPNGSALPVATRISSKLASAGFVADNGKARGVKTSSGLYELRNTKMGAVIVEVCFVEATGDVALYKKLGYDYVGKLIAEAIVNKSISDGSTTPVPPNPIVKHPIMGQSTLDSYSLAQFVLKNNPSPKLNCTIEELATYFITEGSTENIRGDIAFCQAIKETGYFKYGGDVVPEQNNYSGLGTTGGGVKGAYFKTPQEGVRAQIQHLKAYASSGSLKNPCVDPRYNLVSPKGKAPYWEDLNGNWAVPGTNYGQDILKIFNSIPKLKGGKKMDLVLYFGSVDKFGAEYIADFYKLPLLSLEYFNDNPLVKNNVGKIYLIGGNEELKPTKDTILISGSGRYDTAQAVTDYLNKVRK